MERLSKSINVLNDVAMGRRKSDLVLDGCSLVSVYTGEIVPDTQVAVVNGRIAYVGSDAAYHISKTKTIHLGGKYLLIFKLKARGITPMNYPKEIKRYCPKCKNTLRKKSPYTRQENAGLLP